MSGVQTFQLARRSGPVGDFRRGQRDHDGCTVKRGVDAWAFADVYFHRKLAAEKPRLGAQAFALTETFHLTSRDAYADRVLK